MFSRQHLIRAIVSLGIAPAVLLSQTNTAPQPQPGSLASTVPSLTVAAKFDYRVVQAFGLKGFGGAAVGAAIGQELNTPGKWGQGAEGYAKRYISGFSQNFAHQVFAFGLESAFHEDPRYFPCEEKRFSARIGSVLHQTYTTHTDRGGQEFAYARFGSAFGAAFLANSWQPSGNNSVKDGLVRGAIMIGSDSGYNFLQEFVPFIRPRSIRHHY